MKKPFLSLPRIPLLLALLIPPCFLHGEEKQSTVITSGHMEMQGTAEKNYFYFSEDVEVKGTNLDLSCDQLTVISLREGPEGATIGTIGAIEQIVAQGDVAIHQAGRSAYAGRAEVNPHEGTVILMDNPRIIDGDVEVEGYQFVLHKGERKFESIPDPNAPVDQPSRSIVRLGEMPDLGFDQEEESVSVDEMLEVPAVELEEQTEETEGGPDGNP